MIGRLARGLWAVAACFCVATVLALVIGVGVVWQGGHLTRSRVRDVIGAARGERGVYVAQAERDEGAERTESPSLEEIDEQQSIAKRAMELRESALRNGLADLAFEQARLAEEKGRFEYERTAFRTELDQKEQGLASSAQENVRLLWESMKSKQVKDQVVLMVEEGKIDDVVTLLAAMPIARRAKIAGEFKEPDEVQMLADILDRMRQGVPDAALIEAARQKLDNPSSTTQ
jgi:hypothetical protein